MTRPERNPLDRLAREQRARKTLNGCLGAVVLTWCAAIMLLLLIGLARWAL